MGEGLLRASLQAAVPRWQDRYRTRPLDVLLAMAPDRAAVIAARGDEILYPSKRKGGTAEAFNALAQGLAILSFMPGGVTFLGVHWETDHPDRPLR